LPKSIDRLVELRSNVVRLTGEEIWVVRVREHLLEDIQGKLAV